MRLWSESKVGSENGQFVVGLQGCVLGFFNMFVERFFILGPGQIVFDWANGDEILNSEFLGKFCGGLDVSVFVGGQSVVIVSEVNCGISAFEAELKRLHASGKMLVNLHTTETSLPSVNRLSVWPGINELDGVELGILLKEGRDD